MPKNNDNKYTNKLPTIPELEALDFDDKANPKKKQKNTSAAHEHNPKRPRLNH